MELETVQPAIAARAATIDETTSSSESTKQIQYPHGNEAKTVPLDSGEQQVYIHNETDSNFESTQSLQLNPEVASTSESLEWVN